jgi:hypothetical protein
MSLGAGACCLCGGNGYATCGISREDPTINLLRESNATLRADSEAHAKRSRELDAKLKGLIQELDPLRERTRTMQGRIGRT